MEIKKKSKNRLTLYIGIALVLGIALGFVFNKKYVGTENTKIVDADLQLQAIEGRIHQAMQPVNPSLYEANQKAIDGLEARQADVRKHLLDAGSESLLDTLTLLKQSISKIKLEQARLVDTLTTDFKHLSASFSEVSLQKQQAVISRDKKLEPFFLLADIFIRLIKMIVGPLVFFTLVVGVAKLGDIKAVGRIGGKTLLWFLGASLTSLFLGMILVNIFQPGSSMNLVLPEESIFTGVDKATLTLKDFIHHLVPVSFADAMAKNEILQIVIFSILFGVATAALGDFSAPLIKAFDAIAHIVLKLTGYVMLFAPVAVFGAMVGVIAKQGLGVLSTYSIFIVEFYFGLFVLWIVLILAGSVFIKKRIFNLLKHIKEPALLAFSTSSSEAAFPQTMVELERFGCNPRIVSFVLPLGYSFNLDGSMMYMTFASIFIAQSYGIHLDFGTQITMLLVLMLTSKGIAGVPRASLVVIAGTLATFHIPEAGIALLLGIDPLLDMGRSGTNILGNSIATTVVSKWEGQLKHSH